MDKLNLVINKKKEVEKLNKEISKTNKLEEKLKIFKKILEIDNTEKSSILNYLILFKEIHKNDKDKYFIKKELELYKNHISKKEFNDNFSEYITKESSSIEKINLIIQKILENNWFLADYKIREKTVLFFYKQKEENKNVVNNSCPITWENSELFIYICFKEFIEQIYKKMNYYKEKSEDFDSVKLDKQDKLINEMEEAYKTWPKDKKEEFRQLINNAKENRKTINLIEGNFFKSYLFNLNKFFNAIKDTFLNDFTNLNFNSKENQQIFEYFIFYISNYEFENLEREAIKVWEYSFKELDYKEKIDIIESFKAKNYPIEFSLKEGNENTLLVNFIDFQKTREIENINDYEISGLCSNIYETSNYNRFNKYNFIKYVKIPKIRNHLCISDIMKDWISFNICIFNSNVIKSLYKTLFEKQNDYILDEKELQIILENICYYSFETDFKGLTISQTLKLYEYGPLIELGNEDLSKLIFLAFYLVINLQEILGYYNIGYQRFFYYENKHIYNSLFVSKELSSEYSRERDGRESGEDIEIKLYGRVIYSLTLKEALFILDLQNYTNDYETFRKNFKKCNDNELIINPTLNDILINMFKIKTNNLPKNGNIQFQLDRCIKNYYNKNSYTYIIQGKHPLGFDIDGKYIEKNSNEIEKSIEIINNLDKDLEKEFLKLLNKK